MLNGERQTRRESGMDSPRVKSPRARRDVARARDKNDSPRLLFMLGAYLEASVFPRTTRFPIRLSSLLYNLRGRTTKNKFANGIQSSVPPLRLCRAPVEQLLLSKRRRTGRRDDTIFHNKFLYLRFSKRRGGEGNIWINVSSLCFIPPKNSRFINENENFSFLAEIPLDPRIPYEQRNNAVGVGRSAFVGCVYTRIFSYKGIPSLLTITDTWPTEIPRKSIPSSISCSNRSGKPFSSYVRRESTKKSKKKKRRRRRTNEICPNPSGQTGFRAFD